MALPPINPDGELPPGIHGGSWAEIKSRFGTNSPYRERAFAKLQLLHSLASRTGHLRRFLIFGSFVSGIPAPRDIDLVLVMSAEFTLEDAPRETQTLFAHADADARFGASIFWLREGALPDELFAEFLETWQVTRDGRRRGMVEIEP